MSWEEIDERVSNFKVYENLFYHINVDELHIIILFCFICIKLDKHNNNNWNDFNLIKFNQNNFF